MNPLSFLASGRKALFRIAPLLIFSGISASASAQKPKEVPLPSSPHGGREPLTVRNMRPYSLIFLQFMPEGGDVLKRKETRFGLGLEAANNLLRPTPSGGSTVIEDNEYQRLLFSAAHGFGKGTEARLFIPLLYRNGGFMDELIAGWHRFWGISYAKDNPGGRPGGSNYQSRLFLQNAAGTTLVNSGNAFGLGDISLTLKKQLTRPSPRSASALRLGIKLPTGNPALFLGSGNVDAGLDFDLRYSLGREVTAYLSAGVTAMGRASRLPGAASGLFQGTMVLEYHPNRRDSYFLQIDGSGASVTTGNAFADRAHFTGTFGYKRGLNARSMLFASFTENGDINDYSAPIFGDIGPDIAFSVGIEWRLGK